MAKFVKAAHSKVMVMVDMGDGKQVWAKCTDAVLKWAKEHFQEGDEVTIDSSNKGGMLFISKMSKPGTSEPSKTTTSAPTATSAAPKKTYQAQEEPKKEYKQSYSGTGEDIRRQNAVHGASRALIALQGSVDINNIFDLTARLYAHFWTLNGKGGDQVLKELDN